MSNLRTHEQNLTRQLGAEVRSRRQSVGNGAGVAVALGGGFSRGFAHLGVLEVLEQERIPISAIVGTSIGGLLGAAYADGISIEELCDLGRQVRIRDFLRFQVPGHGSQGNDRIGGFVREWFQARHVEELPIPTAIVTTDLDTCASHVFTAGPLEVAIRASCAFPGLFKPVEYQGRLLADGCIVAPVPTVVAARMNARCVLAVAVTSHQKTSSLDREAMLKSSWTRYADILLEPEVHQIDWKDFSRVDEARAAGADAMRRALPYVRNFLDRQPHLQRAAGTSSGMESGLIS